MMKNRPNLVASPTMMYYTFIFMSFFLLQFLVVDTMLLSFYRQSESFQEEKKSHSSLLAHPNLMLIDSIHSLWGLAKAALCLTSSLVSLGS